MPSLTDTGQAPQRIEQVPWHARFAGWLVRIVPVLAVLLAWELVSRSEWVNPRVFPPVTEIVARWLTLFLDGAVYGPLWDTLWRALLGLFAAILVGVPLGLWMGRSRRAEWFFEPLFSIGFPLPKIALIPLYVHWFGLFSLSKVMLIFTDCLFPIVLFTYHGARGVSPIYLWSAQARGTSSLRSLWRVVLPLSLASIYDGVQVAVVVAVLVAVVSEMVSGGGGLGTMMIRAYRYGDVRTAFATLVTISLIGYILYRLAQWARERLLFWHVTEA
jgi:ABC-type nitrate/sulfonate/bicarbonate transport system permease component